VFDRIVVGVEESDESLVAVRQAGRLVEPDRRVILTAVADLALAVHGGWRATPVWEEIKGQARTALDAASAEAPEAETLLIDGEPGDALLKAARSQRADLMAVGTHGGSRAKGILLGSVATLMLHDAPCSVLVARASMDEAEFPRRIFMGIDGSASSAKAATVASALARRFGAAVTAVAACGGKKINLDELRAIEPRAEMDHRPPVEALIERAAEAGADLLVVGSRGLRGVSALGSVSERVAHRASCSVLVIREKEGGVD
jgi:nucleotide-binding universal stress UspA family protein